MMRQELLWFTILLILFSTDESLPLNGLDKPDEIFMSFPDDFVWISGTSAFQTEGAWNLSGKGESIWDRFAHEDPKNIVDHSNADVADDSYHQYPEDLRLAKELGLSAYRFSLSWTRLLPTAFSDKPNPDGIRYYKTILKELKKLNMDFQVTMHHFDYPQALQDMGGWLNASSVDWFDQYADFCFKTFPEIKFWYTINQPHIMSAMGYDLGAFAPGVFDGTGHNFYVANKNQLIAHAKAYRRFYAQYNFDGKGKIAPCYDGVFFTPKDPRSAEDVAAAERAMTWNFGFYTHPIFSINGGWPPLAETQMAKLAREQNTTNRLPPLTWEEIQLLKGSADFFGYNYYSTSLTTPAKIDLIRGSFTDPEYAGSVDPKWPSFGEPGRPMVPWGMRGTFQWFVDQYGPHWDLYVVENGVAQDKALGLNDVFRNEFYRLHLLEALKIINIDGYKLKGFGFWAFLDNFEWAQGYSRQYGMISVDFQDPKRTRTPKESFYYLKKLIANHGIVINATDLAR